MAKKLITFLGAGKYKECRYKLFNDQESEVVQYIQEALAQTLCKEWTVNDSIHIFLTEDAENNNWNNKLQTKLENMDCRFRVIPVSGLKKGFSEKDIWTNFQMIFEKINLEDEIWLDITNAFRSIPTFAVVLLNYAKFLKKINVKGILYGAFEALGNPRDIDERIPIPMDRLAPIFNLSNLIELQNWTNAANEFLQLGQADNLTKLIKTTQPEIADQLLSLEDGITTCRGNMIAYELDFKKLNSSISESKTSELQNQLAPLITKIEDKIKPFSNRASLQNGFAAVEWCIYHKMVQQGITFLQETLVTHVIEKTSNQEFVINRYYRELAGSALNQIYYKTNNCLSNNVYKKFALEKQLLVEATYKKMYSYVKDKKPLSKIYKNLVGSDGVRNDINHCGFKEHYSTPDELTSSLKEIYSEIKNLNL